MLKQIFFPVELRLAQLALDRNNSPAWDLPDHVRTPSTKLPLFVKALPVFSSKHQTEVSVEIMIVIDVIQIFTRILQKIYFLLIVGLIFW